MVSLKPGFAGLKSSRKGGVAGAFLSIGIGLILLWLPLSHLANWSYDLPFNYIFKSEHVPDDVVIVYMDEPSHVALNQPHHEPWDRSLHAELVRRLAEAGAKAVVFDVVFFGAGPDAEADRKFASAIAEYGNVILAGEVLRYEERGAEVEQLLAPFAPFREASAGWGLVQVALDDGRAVRRHLHEGVQGVPSLSWAVASHVGADTAGHSGRKGKERWLHYYGPPGSLPHVGFHQALHADGVPPDFFRDRIVFIGAKQTTGFTGTGMDEFATPYFSFAQRVAVARGGGAVPPVYAPGVEVHASTFLNLLRDDGLRRVSGWGEFGLVVAFGLAFGFFLPAFRPLAAVGLGLIGAMAIAFGAWLLFWYQNIWFVWLILVAQVGAAGLWAVLYYSMQWYVEQKLMMQTLSLHLSPTRAKAVMARPDLLHPGAEIQTISILFSDIANFSGIAESMPPDDLADFLNQYFEASISSIHSTDGTVVKLIGDSIFAIWNAPGKQANHHERACRAALLLRDQLLGFDRTHKSLPSLRTRVGLHVGTACVGNFGSSTRFDYTAIGDAVNLASRLEGLNKFLGTDLLMSGDVAREVAGMFTARNVGRFVLKGMKRSVEVHELMGIEEEGRTPGSDSSFGRGLEAYQAGDFGTASRLFGEALAERPEDGPARFYLERIAAENLRPFPGEWTGEVVLSEK